MRVTILTGVLAVLGLVVGAPTALATTFTVESGELDEVFTGSSEGFADGSTIVLEGSGLELDLVGAVSSTRIQSSSALAVEWLDADSFVVGAGQQVSVDEGGAGSPVSSIVTGSCDVGSGAIGCTLNFPSSSFFYTANQVEASAPDPIVTPEPAAPVLFGLGSLLIGLRLRRRGC